MDESPAGEIIKEVARIIPVDGEIIQLRRDASENSARREPVGPLPEVARYHPFQVYVYSFPDSSCETANVYVATGTVLESESDIESIVPINGLADLHLVGFGDWVYLAVEFDEDGAVLDCTLTVGATWPSYPSLVSASGGGNFWYHPIAQLRSPKLEKLTTEIDPGEYPQLASAFIAQKTNTHLVVVRDCIDGELVWKLQPGQGGKD